MNALLKPDRKAIQQHLDIIFEPIKPHYPSGLILIQALHPETDDHPFATFGLKDIATASDCAVNYNKQGYNVYYGVNPRKPNTRDSGNSNDIEIAIWQFADFDTEASAEKFKRSTGKPQPSLIVMTGDIPNLRFHTYFLLNKPCTDMDAWRNTQLTLIKYYGSDSKIKDSRRIMRLAGTVSFPNSDKVSRGYLPYLVRIANAPLN